MALWKIIKKQMKYIYKFKMVYIRIHSEELEANATFCLLHDDAKELASEILKTIWEAEKKTTGIDTSLQDWVKWTKTTQSLN